MRNKEYKKLRNRIEEAKNEILFEIRREKQKQKKIRLRRFNFRGMETKFFISLLTCTIFILSSIILFDSMLHRVIYFVIAELITDILIWKSKF
jgi:hypothetical protein